MFLRDKSFVLGGGGGPLRSYHQKGSVEGRVRETVISTGDVDDRKRLAPEGSTRSRASVSLKRIGKRGADDDAEPVCSTSATGIARRRLVQQQPTADHEKKEFEFFADQRVFKDGLFNLQGCRRP